MGTPRAVGRSVYTRLSLYYFFFFATLGSFLPYWSVYLKSLGFSAAEIGELMAIVLASKVVSPYLLGWLADHFRQPLKIIRFSSFITVFVFAGVFAGQGFGWLVFVMGLFGFFWNASLPLFEALSLNYLGNNTDRYSHIRLWGSVGFIVLVVSLPSLIENSGISRLPILILLLLGMMAFTTLFIQEKPYTESSHVIFRTMEIVKSPLVFVFLIACTLQAISHGAYYTFFSIYLEDHGYSRLLTGWMWGLGVIAEVVIFVLMHRLLSRFGVCQLFNFALIMTGLRWTMLALWVDNLVFLVVSQCLHAASFGLFHASAIDLIHRLFPGRLQARGQALYAGLSFGLGGSLGNLISGYIWDLLGSTETFFFSAVVATLAAGISMIYVRKARFPDYSGGGNSGLFVNEQKTRNAGKH